MMKGKIYKRSDDMELREVGAELILIPVAASAEDTDSIYVLNETGAAAWDLFDGVLTLREMAEEIAQGFEVTPERALEDLELYVEELLAAGALEEV